MPFLWKKMKSTRISQLVNDHLNNSQKRRDGSSLVVETGFPTSLIDLFIKNREKLKTPSKKKRRNPPISDQLTVPFPPPPSIAGSLTPTHSPLRCPSPLHNLSVLPSPSRCDSGISAVGLSDGVDEKEGDDGRTVADVNKVLFGVLKIFLVVVLALGTKRLAVGITISAFLLLFIEYAGRHVIVRRIISRFKEIKSDEKNNGALIMKTKSLDQEIQEVESVIQPIIDEPFFQESELVEKEELVCHLVESESKKKSSRSNIIKSKMKKYVTRKFKSSKKQNDLQRGPEEEQVDQFINDGESSSSSSSSSTSWRMQGDEDGANAIRLSQAIEEANNKGKEVEGGVTWRHLVLCLIVLTGLLGGRAFALVLTLSWFLVLKLGQKLPRFIKSG